MLLKILMEPKEFEHQDEISYLQVLFVGKVKQQL